MSILLLCPSCDGKMKVPDRLVGRKARCPRCGNIIDVDADAAAAAPGSKDDDYDDEPAPQARRRPQEEYDDEAEAPPRRRRHEEDGEEGITTAAGRGQAREAEGGNGEDCDDEPRPKRRKKKRRRRQAEQQEEEGFVLPDWAWWAGAGAGAFVMLLTFGLILAIGGPSSPAGAIVIYLIVMLPISFAVLVVSMFVSSALAGGIEFGEPLKAVIKAIPLIMLVNLVNLLPFYIGFFLGLGIWFFGFMFLFGLDMWEARFLVCMNWIMSMVLNLVLLAALYTALTNISAKQDRGLDSPPPRQGQPANVFDKDEDMEDFGARIEFHPKLQLVP